MNFLDEEVRNDFLVDKKRKKIWLVELNIYLELKRVCDKYGLKMFAGGGTCLGAVRHDGFIPWDDDLDISMCREDYDKLCEVGPKEFKEPYFFQYALTDRNYFIGMARLRKSDTTGIVTFLSNHIYNNGIYVDIYVYDKIPEDKKDLRSSIFKIKALTCLMDNYYHFNNVTKSKKLDVLRPFFSLTKFLVSYEKLYELFIKECSKYNNSSSNRYGTMCVPYFLKYEVTQDGIDNIIQHKFEYTEMPIPGDYDRFLTMSYGNYMEFPPVEQRGLWHEDIIIFDPDIPYMQYYKEHAERFTQVLKEYEAEKKENKQNG